MSEAGTTIRAGDHIRVIGIPNDLPDDELQTSLVFNRCVGETFVVASVAARLIELEVGRVVGEPSWKHSIWIEAKLVELVSSEP